LPFGFTGRTWQSSHSRTGLGGFGGFTGLGGFGGFTFFALVAYFPDL
jgi:hypothetical protein